MRHFAGQAPPCHLPPLPVPVFSKLGPFPFCFSTSCSLVFGCFLSNSSLLFLVGVCKTLCSQRACLPMADALVSRHGPSPVAILAAGCPEGPRASGMLQERTAWPGSRCPDCLRVTPVCKPDWPCPHLPVVPSLLTLGRASILDAGGLLTAIPLASLVQLPSVAAWVWPRGPAMVEAHPSRKPGLQGLQPRVSSTVRPGLGVASGRVQQLPCPPLPSSKERRERNRNGEWQKEGDGEEREVATQGE